MFNKMCLLEILISRRYSEIMHCLYYTMISPSKFSLLVSVFVHMFPGAQTLLCVLCMFGKILNSINLSIQVQDGFHIYIKSRIRGLFERPHHPLLMLSPYLPFEHTDKHTQFCVKCKFV
jgi:hypothetical protein